MAAELYSKCFAEGQYREERKKIGIEERQKKEGEREREKICYPSKKNKI